MLLVVLSGEMLDYIGTDLNFVVNYYMKGIP